MERVGQSAHAHAGPVAGLEAASGLAAGAKLSPGQGARNKAGEIAAQTSAQAGLGAAGEAAGQVAQGKTDLEIGQIMAEAAGELSQTPMEVAGAGLSRLVSAPKPGSAPGAPTPDAPIPAEPPGAPNRVTSTDGLGDRVSSPDDTAPDRKSDV